MTEPRMPSTPWWSAPSDAGSSELEQPRPVAGSQPATTGYDEPPAGRSARPAADDDPSPVAPTDRAPARAGEPLAEPTPPAYGEPTAPAYGAPGTGADAGEPAPPWYEGGGVAAGPGQPAGGEPVAPAAQPVGPPAPAAAGSQRTRRGRRRRALLPALALLAAGGTGGAVVAAVDDASGQGRGSAAPAAVSTLVGTSNSSSSTATSATGTAGTPVSAAAVIGPSVVTIEVTGAQTSTDGTGQQQSVSDTGSGIVLRPDGYVLTNNHVVAAALSGGTVHVTLPDGRTVSATIVGHDTSDDLAVIRLSGATGLVAATFADSQTLKVGQTVLAVGAPLGLSNTVTQGIVSTLHRPVRTGEAGASSQSVIDAVQTDAAINPGNSGGALVDLSGHVVGINSAIASTGSSGSGQSGNIGVGFAIPSADAVKVANQLIADGHATHSQIGVSIGNAASSTDGAPGLGATVKVVTKGGPADKAGLRSGDLITQVDSRRVTDADSLIVAIRSHDPRSTVTVTYLRGGATRTAKVTLGSAVSD